MATAMKRRRSIAISKESGALHIFASDLGWMALAWSGKRVTRLSIGHPSAIAAAVALEQEDLAVSTPESLPGWISDLAVRLQAFAAGDDVSFADVPLALDHLSAFQANVVRACRRIGRGSVKSYGELADAAGSAGAARAVGSVMANNRFPILVPCHRVVAAGGLLGGFTCRDGVNMKRRMLALEGVELSASRVGQASRLPNKITAAGELNRRQQRERRIRREAIRG